MSLQRGTLCAGGQLLSDGPAQQLDVAQPVAAGTSIQCAAKASGISQKTIGHPTDGAKLVAEVFSLDAPRLIFSELVSKNDQKGFIRIGGWGVKPPDLA
ncbi:hypothetical protein R69746_08213 [Paraburkholderia aspalathi]|uniref:hypothetical protein n=1 Tax=Paraburkholderia aspalathi TaxID=1324617 RepID=UPI00190D1042|nr:hypothetical protein [Paraburkholderia aspalathi]MBK3844140.1 hypothetical protein [Paraburkholderia aspalathi]CAE6867806.1 hypothetical protein R69746_08213 [Paraburkholderia aspalathi]